MKILKKNKGFTLIELIVVVAVLAALAAIAIPVGTSILNTANSNVDASNVALYQNAIEKYVANGGSYPTDASSAVTAIDTYINVTLVGGILPAPKTSGQMFLYTPATTTVSLGTAAVAPVVALSAAAS